MKKNIHFIITGGTIDKLYDPIGQGTKTAKESTMPLYVQNVINPAGGDLSFETVCMIDSLEMTDSLRQQVTDAVLRSNEDCIIITHGTDTMSVTAEFLKDRLPKDNKKTIVLTGALTPLKEFAMSDGGFNLGYAMAVSQILEPGVYISMHANIWPAGTVAKNKDTARFENK